MVFAPWLTVLAAAGVVSLWGSARMLSASWSAMMRGALRYEMNAASSIPNYGGGGGGGGGSSWSTEAMPEIGEGGPEESPESLESASVTNASALHQNQTMGAFDQNSASDQTSTTIIHSSERSLFLSNGKAARDQTIPSPSRIVPRIVHLEESRLGNLRGGSEPTFKALLDVPSNVPVIKPHWFAPSAHDFVSEYDPKECEPMEEWQLDGRPNCNAFHELDLRHARFLAEGGERVVFEATDGDEAAFVFKTVRYKRAINGRKLEEQRRDALVVDRASSSRFVPDVYGYCGVGLAMPSLPGGDLLDYTRSARLPGGSSLSPVDKLRVALHIASGVRDMHSMSLFYHFDVAEDQFLFDDDVFKLNDFAYGSSIYINKTSKEHCTLKDFKDEHDSVWKGRSFEEFQHILKYANYTAPDPTKVDVWMMGNAIFTVLTNEYLFEKPRLGWKDSARKLLRGERSPFPKHIEESTNPSHAAVKTALDMCWMHRWQERPSAEIIASYLHSQLRQITGEDDPDIRVVLPERDPNQKLTWGDYLNVNCDRKPNGGIRDNC